MRLALLTSANPMTTKSGHSCLIGSGKFKLVADGDIKSKVAVRCENVKRTSSLDYSLDSVVDGPVVATVIIVHPSEEDKAINIYAERVE